MLWLAFGIAVTGMMAFDLGWFKRTSRPVEVKEALMWSGAWVGLSLLFAGVVYCAYANHWAGAGRAVDAVDGLVNDGRLAVVKYLTGYALEMAMSVDNIFVFSLLFKVLAVPPERRHRALMWGVVGAVVLRGAMIGIGVKLIWNYYPWIFYGFGAFLVASAAKMLAGGAGDSPCQRGLAARAASAAASFVPPLAAAVIVIEVADVLFALDSIPAVLAITADPFLVLTSNIFAVLGLRSLYFALDGLMGRFRHLRTALAVVLGVVGVKMLAAARLVRMRGPETDLWVLGLILAILGAGVVASWRSGRERSI